MLRVAGLRLFAWNCQIGFVSGSREEHRNESMMLDENGSLARKRCGSAGQRALSARGTERAQLLGAELTARRSAICLVC